LHFPVAHDAHGILPYKLPFSSVAVPFIDDEEFGEIEKKREVEVGGQAVVVERENKDGKERVTI
jgi:hypothetical protein